MKVTLPLFLVVIALFAGSGCGGGYPAELNDADRALIIDSIRAAWDSSIEGIARADAQQAFDVFSHTSLDRYVRDGYLYPSIDAARMEYRQAFRPIREQSVRYDTIEVQILDRNTAVLTALGQVLSTDTAGTTIGPLSLAWTSVWRRTSGRWSIVNMHISFPAAGS